MKVAIIGAGITRVTTAYFLSEKKIRCHTNRGRRYPAMATSYANGGQLSASNSESLEQLAQYNDGGIVINY